MKKRNRPLSNQLHPRTQWWSKISSSESPVHKLVFVSLCFRWPSLVGLLLLKMALETVRRSTLFTSKLLLTAAAALSVAPKLLRAEFCSDGKCSDEVEKAKLASDAAEKYRPEDSIFSKIIRKEIPADIIHEDEKVSSVILCLQPSFFFFSLFLGNRDIPQFFSSKLVLEAGWGYHVIDREVLWMLVAKKKSFFVAVLDHKHFSLPSSLT